MWADLATFSAVRQLVEKAILRRSSSVLAVRRPLGDNQLYRSVKIFTLQFG